MGSIPWTRRAPRALLLAAALAGPGLALPALPAAGQAPPPAQPADPGAELLRRASESRVRGAKEAPVTVLEVADFQCPVCARFFHEVYPAIDSAYIRTGKVQWVMLNLPLTSHRNAWPAAEAALCAGVAGGRFWEMHDRLYQTQPAWAGAEDPGAHLLGLAREVGVAEAAYRACVEGDRVAVLLLQDALGLVRAGISSTPSFIVGNELAAVGVKSFDEWRTILDGAIEKAKAEKKPD